MITARARAGFEQLARAGFRCGLQTAAGDPCMIESATSLDKIRARKVAVLTVSSYLFRLVTAFYFRDDTATRAYFGGASEQEFLDRVAERGNICCGSLNRELGRYFPHVGMSTPHVIDRDCMRHAALLGGGLLNHYRLHVADDVSLHASLCVSDHGLVDFQVDATPEQAHSTGELQLF